MRKKEKGKKGAKGEENKKHSYAVPGHLERVRRITKYVALLKKKKRGEKKEGPREKMSKLNPQKLCTEQE